MKHAIVIGAGIGGLSAACLLAAEGYKVTVYEKNSTPGGKMQERVRDGYRFDTGPSLLTMPFVLEKLFERCGENLHDYLAYTDLQPICRYFYPDGVVFDNYSDKKLNAAELKKFAPKDVSSYSKFLKRSEKLYNRTADAFLFNPLYSIKDLKFLSLFNLLRIDALSTVSKKVDRYFSSPHLRQFFKRFSTYNGSSPYQAPATLNVIPHVELNQGGYYVKGGLYQIARSLFKLAEKSGVNFQFNQTVISLDVSGKKINGVKFKKGSIEKADVVVANSDATDTLLNLIPGQHLSNRKKKSLKKIEPSCSGFVLLLGCNKQWEELKHHNIFFSDNYKKEFQDIFQEKHMPENPTIYVANSSYTDPSHAPEGASNLFVLINAPYVVENQNWEEVEETYSSFIISELEKRGLTGLEASLDLVEKITPVDFRNMYRSNRGSIYGTSSNSKFSAFLRPRNKVRFLDNLYLVGGSSHPGGGIPLVVQSAFNAMDLMNRHK